MSSEVDEFTFRSVPWFGLVWFGQLLSSSVIWKEKKDPVNNVSNLDCHFPSRKLTLSLIPFGRIDDVIRCIWRLEGKQVANYN